MRFPPATEILEVVRRVGRPRGLAAVRTWTSGKISPPLWAVLAIAEATGLDLGDLVREFVARWERHPWRNS